jgi:hypothetical protein
VPDRGRGVPRWTRWSRDRMGRSRVGCSSHSRHAS